MEPGFSIGPSLDIARICQRKVQQVHEYVKCQSTSGGIRIEQSRTAECNHQSSMDDFDTNLTAQLIGSDVKQPNRQRK